MSYNNVDRTITTERLLLRLFTSSDAAAVARLCNNYNIYKTTLYLPYPYTLEDALSWIDRHEGNFDARLMYEFAVTDKLSGEVYGAIALSCNEKSNNGELAYWIGEEYWGRGYATEAAEAMVDFAFEDRHYHKVFARYFSSNTASGKVMEKIGMSKEGILREHIRKENRYHDLVHYGIVRT
ncbi:acetyltransferase [Paenibacillus sp. FSL R7-0273]|uniref:GNAT family N-acetyltransferase n=1 Tax=Paenibacillus sp. FSL R7-0273 TaxID=1536772 RepID=UPI0004F70F26|nr:GNAT family N-acetyltransferase [Paenibacillus sp. FSL R7-0273]AIQ48488.1 acetyltransferase [Paenibacillus sp. FSL R7-0273]OMF86298.1 GNAT family N-acetyltransferase [Paenibacillus sp. FSL R7-0273]